MKTTLEYWDDVSYTSCNREIKGYKEISGVNIIDIFEQFYKLNRSLSYTRAYYKFSDKKFNDAYMEWLKSDDYKSKSFNLFYGNGIVD